MSSSPVLQVTARCPLPRATELMWDSHMRAGNPTIMAVTPGGPPNSQCEWVSASRSLRRASSVTEIDELELLFAAVAGAAFRLRLDVFLTARLTGPSFAIATDTCKKRVYGGGDGVGSGRCWARGTGAQRFALSDASTGTCSSPGTQKDIQRDGPTLKKTSQTLRRKRRGKRRPKKKREKSKPK